MNKIFKAHVDETGERIQTIKEHSENTAYLCAQFAVPELKEIVYMAGLLHDIGKYQESFQKKIDGANIRVEHSICGALAVKSQGSDALSLLIEYCIAGHHSGIPDGGDMSNTPDMSTLWGRLMRTTEDYSCYKQELSIPDIDRQRFYCFLMSDCNQNIDLIVDKFAFLTRYCFSCLVDADSVDTAKFCSQTKIETLETDFKRCLKKVDAKLQSFKCKTDLQRSRAYLQKRVFEKVDRDSEVYLMNMPTGSGKTLCSVKFALERAVRTNKKHIIYVIPYNGIIDQTVEVFEEIFGADAKILRHQSTFSYDSKEYSEDYRRYMKSAAENWDAQFIITTAVQFFESVYANRRGKLRKLHNIADSILIFDEAHVMPVEYLQPCLRAIAYAARYLNSEAVFLTATMPDFSGLMRKYALPDSKIMDLIEDSSLFDEFKKCRFQYLQEVSEEELLLKAEEFPSSLFIVNKRAAAKRLFQICSGRKYHLSTYMTPCDRQRVLREIRCELRQLELEYPDGRKIPEERRIIIISTSLIEAGIDLDVHTVFRELAGLDNILQAGGRCNREGKRKKADVYVFELKDDTRKASMDERCNLVRGLIRQYVDISCEECIKEYYNRLFQLKQEMIQKNSISWDCKDIRSIPFREYAEKFELINSNTFSVVVPQDEKSRHLVETLKYTGAGVERELQPYACTVYRWELEDLIRQNAVDDFDTGMYCLINLDYYDKETGISFEAKDYWID